MNRQDRQDARFEEPDSELARDERLGLWVNFNTPLLLKGRASHHLDALL